MMDQFLAEFYGTNKTASAPQEDLEKQATVDLFVKLAAEQNIDLTAMKDEDVQRLYNNFTANIEAEKTAAAAAPAKTASEEKEEHEKKKLEEAKKEHEEKHAMAKKAQEADAMGRIMAHAYVQELRKIAAANKEAELPPQFAAHMKGKEEGKEHEEKKEPHEEKKEEHKEHEHEDKKASALDDLATKHAIAMAVAEKYDAKECEAKIAAVRTLNLAPQTTKTASAPTVEEAIGIRALELLEAAKYPVTWK